MPPAGAAVATVAVTLLAAGVALAPGAGVGAEYVVPEVTNPGGAARTLFVSKLPAAVDPQRWLATEAPPPPGSE